MPRRHVLTDRQRSALFDLPTDEVDLLRHCTLADDDLEHIRVRRRPQNRLGFALQLCAFRHPGRLLHAGEVIPSRMLNFIGAQIGVQAHDLESYAVREETRREHLQSLRAIYGYRMFAGRRAVEMTMWLEREAEEARSSENLARRFVEECRRAQTILRCAPRPVSRVSSAFVVHAVRGCPGCRRTTD